MAETKLMQIRVDAAVRAEVDEICHALGLSTNEAINLFFHQILLHDGIPFPLQKSRPDGGVFVALDDADAVACGVLHTKSCANASKARGRSFMLTIKQMSQNKKSNKKKKSDDNTAAGDKRGGRRPIALLRRWRACIGLLCGHTARTAVLFLYSLPLKW